MKINIFLEIDKYVLKNYKKMIKKYIFNVYIILDFIKFFFRSHFYK